MPEGRGWEKTAKVRGPQTRPEGRRQGADGHRQGLASVAPPDRHSENHGLQISNLLLTLREHITLLGELDWMYKFSVSFRRVCFY